MKTKRTEKRNERRMNSSSEDEVGLTSSKLKNVKAEDVAWKKIQGDVFRKPDFVQFLCVLIGAGV